jgi:AraC-like DNA-binding protein
VNTASSLASFVTASRKALDAAGVDSAAVLKAAGIDPAVLDDPHARIPLPQTTRLWRLAVEATGDSAFGLKVASQITPTSFRALSFALMASDTFKDAFERIVRYFRVVTDAADLEFQRVGEEYQLRMLMPTHGVMPAHEGVDAYVSMYVRMCRSRLGSAYSPLYIHLRRPPPADLGAFEAAWRCPIHFEAAENMLAFSRESFERRLEGGDADLARHNETIVQRELAQLAHSNIAQRVRDALIEQLPNGEPSAAHMAAGLCLSARSLQRKLAELNTSYRQLLDSTRHELAMAYIKSPQYSITEITFLLGFADTRSFARAFRRWMGVAPSQYRARS